MLPAYFARRLGLDVGVDQGVTSSMALALSAGAITTAGVVLAFGVAGILISLGLAALGAALPWAGFIIGLILVAVGLYVLAGHHVGLRLPQVFSDQSANGLKGDFLFGFGYGVASLSCTLPIFLSVTALATTGSIVESTAGFVAFGLGMGTILTAIAVAAAASQEGLARGFKRFFPYANAFGGVILLLAGAYIVFYWGSLLLSSELPSSAGLVAQGEQVSSLLKTWVGSETGQTVVFGLLGVFAFSASWILWKRGKTKSRRAGISVE